MADCTQRDRDHRFSRQMDSYHFQQAAQRIHTQPHEQDIWRPLLGPRSEQDFIPLEDNDDLPDYESNMASISQEQRHVPHSPTSLPPLPRSDHDSGAQPDKIDESYEPTSPPYWPDLPEDYLAGPSYYGSRNSNGPPSQPDRHFNQTAKSSPPARPRRVRAETLNSDHEGEIDEAAQQPPAQNFSRLLPSDYEIIVRERHLDLHLKHRFDDLITRVYENKYQTNAHAIQLQNLVDQMQLRFRNFERQRDEIQAVFERQLNQIRRIEDRWTEELGILEHNIDELFNTAQRLGPDVEQAHRQACYNAVSLDRYDDELQEYIDELAGALTPVNAPEENNDGDGDEDNNFRISAPQATPPAAHRPQSSSTFAATGPSSQSHKRARSSPEPAPTSHADFPSPKRRKLSGAKTTPSPQYTRSASKRNPRNETFDRLGYVHRSEERSATREEERGRKANARPTPVFVPAPVPSVPSIRQEVPRMRAFRGRKRQR